MAKRFWLIRGYKEFETIYEEFIPQGLLSDRKLRELLTCLAAKEGVTYNEVAGVYVKRGTKLAHGALDVQKNETNLEYICGNYPNFVAVLVDENHDLIKRNLL
ncbi:hypothetical protein GCM10010909_26710 [Acidocella aquatica]|uniref:Uncharacterized protein n=1 Tax=Acidocella aquatica TaxID=1922313 RepID=A0ABQ6A6B0_9PROT|nr:hypothetical protein [Acidocella aquatica]GLR67990.1 hypothetical protein GCM10010909_26710 [Acidocella aquatica]